MLRKSPFRMRREAAFKTVLGTALWGSLALAATASGALHAQSGVIARTPEEIAKAKQSPYLEMVRNISPRELTPGTPIVEASGAPIGTVEKVVGNTIVLTDGRREYRVPIEQLYAYSKGDVDHFASRIPKKKLKPEKGSEKSRRAGG
ncbi:hypothetical protein MTR62_05125 [Novosphingobium sp. 1949]|uniref:PRC-barrel domain-containing protein n=1 Tax=Novosphingobium organovorum TaxID=2930092 RepID=A0ABT0BB93_9SPHN|nr:hypothetical protein [Novosphingobium organovorum]MCJ2182086.1 hypothetical protein [Novosphingobium organovorum]